MKINKGNFILSSMVFLVVLFMISWIVRVQTQKDYPDLTNEIVQREELNKSVVRGREIFIIESCYNCHKPDKMECFSPRLKNISERRSRAFLFQFIRNEQKMIEEGNVEVIALKEMYNGSNGLHNKKHLTDSQIQDMLNYLNNLDQDKGQLNLQEY